MGPSHPPLGQVTGRPYRSRGWTRLWPPLVLGAAAFFLTYTLFPSSFPSLSLRRNPHIPTPQLPSPLTFSLSPSASSSSNTLVHPDLANFFPVVDPVQYDASSWKDRNARAMTALVQCLAGREACGENQTKVVLLGSHHFWQTLGGKLAGENVWVLALLDALDELGYTYLFSQDTIELTQQYRMFPSLVLAVILEPTAIKDCFTDRQCLKTSKHPLGIPFWKLFGFHWWRGDQGHPLGERWTLSPERWPGNDNFYLGYSIERACTERGSFVRFEDRPRQAYILAKKMSYFEQGTYPWTDDAFARAAKEHGVQFIIGMVNDTLGPSTLPPGVKNVGLLSQEDFFASVARSRLLVGIGQPYLSPSPWDALCMGVPFLNPAHGFDRSFPEDRARWVTQHDPMMRLGEPWAYTMRKGDVDGFVRAVGRAMETPVEPFVHPDMTREAMRERTAGFLTYDWRALGEELVRNRTLAGKEVWVV